MANTTCFDRFDLQSTRYMIFVPALRSTLRLKLFPSHVLNFRLHFLKSSLRTLSGCRTLLLLAKMSSERFRLSALFPFVFSSIAFALVLVLVLSGTNPNSVPDGYLLSVSSHLDFSSYSLSPTGTISSHQNRSSELYADL
jgi:hypothetical protein